MFLGCPSVRPLTFISKDAISLHAVTGWISMKPDTVCIAEKIFKVMGS